MLVSRLSKLGQLYVRAAPNASDFRGFSNVFGFWKCRCAGGGGFSAPVVAVGAGDEIPLLGNATALPFLFMMASANMYRLGVFLLALTLAAADDPDALYKEGLRLFSEG